MECDLGSKPFLLGCIPDAPPFIPEAVALKWSIFLSLNLRFFRLHLLKGFFCCSSFPFLSNPPESLKVELVRSTSLTAEQLLSHSPSPKLATNALMVMIKAKLRAVNDYWLPFCPSCTLWTFKVELLPIHKWKSFVSLTSVSPTISSFSRQKVTENAKNSEATVEIQRQIQPLCCVWLESCQQLSQRKSRTGTTTPLCPAESFCAVVATATSGVDWSQLSQALPANNTFSLSLQQVLSVFYTFQGQVYFSLVNTCLSNCWTITCLA